MHLKVLGVGWHGALERHLPLAPSLAVAAPLDVDRAIRRNGREDRCATCGLAATSGRRAYCQVSTPTPIDLVAADPSIGVVVAVDREAELVVLRLVGIDVGHDCAALAVGLRWRDFACVAAAQQASASQRSACRTERAYPQRARRQPREASSAHAASRSRSLRRSVKRLRSLRTSTNRSTQGC